MPLPSKSDVNYRYFEDVLFEKRVWIQSANISNYLILFTKRFLGTRDSVGRTSFRDLLVTLSESEIIPKVIVFWNHAAKSCLDGSRLLPVIHKLEQSGVRILVSGLYLEKRGMKDRLRAGKLANNFDLLAAIHKAQKIVSL
jgi:hypothetical protein